MTAAALMLSNGAARRQVVVRPTLDPNSLTPFVDQLPIPDVVRSTEFRPGPADPKTKVPYYHLAMRQIECKIHRDVKPTRLWGIGSSFPGPTLETQSGSGMLVE